jgi:eukaryotic-like serine/threonine-protein kinase
MTDEAPSDAQPDGPLDPLAEHFDALLALETAAARAEYLESLRGRDAELAGELDGLLRAYLSDTRFLVESLPEEERELVGEEVDGTLTARRVGPWALDGVLHHGGMGTVYLAHRAEADFEQRVALKVIRLGMEHPEAIRRFTLERQLLARLEHPGIARLLDGGTTEDGLPFLVMEYVPGEPIDQWCDRTQPPVDEILRLFDEVCEAVDFAHRNLVIHRDIKPSNLLVTPDGHAKLLDFGIAKLEAGEEGAATVPLTRHRMLTPAWASPEQYRGEPVSTATDVYSLGILLYRLLTGRAPYQIEEGTTIREAERLICDTLPILPSQALPDLDPRRRRLRGDLDTIVMKALRKEPERRYSSALALAEDLQRFRQGRPVSARPDTLGYRARRFATRNWPALAATAAIFVALVAGLGAALWQGAIAEEQRDLARAEAATAASAVQFLKSVLWAGNPWDDDAEAVETVDDVLRYAEVQINPVLADQVGARAFILSALSEISSGRGDLERADRFSVEAMALMETHPDEVGAYAGEILRARSLALQENGRITEARDVVLEAIERLEAREPLPVEALAEALNQAGTLELELGNPEEAEGWFRLILEHRAAHGADAPVLVTRVLNNLAVALMSQPDRQLEAVEALDEAIPTARAAGASDPVVATLVVNQANLLMLLGEWEASEAAFLEAVGLMEASLGSDHPSTLMATISLGSLHEALDAFEHAELLLRPALHRSVATLGADHPTTAYAQNIMAATLCRHGGEERGLEGLVLARASLETRTALLPEDHWLLASGAALEGRCLLELARLDEARPLLESALATLREVQGDEHRITIRTGEWLDLLNARSSLAVSPRSEAL